MRMFDRINSKIKELIDNGETKFIIFPFGNFGAMTKGILNAVYGINEVAIIDNKLCKEIEGIKSLDYLASNKEMLGEYKLLLTTDNVDIYESIRDELYKHIPKTNIVELLPVPIAVTAKRQENKVKEKIDKIIIDISKEMYHAEKTNSKFYLPMVYTDLIQRSIFLSDDYFERNNLEYVFENYKDGYIKDKIKQGIVCDIGANIGNHTLYFVNERDAKCVYAFEPIKMTYNILERNIQNNDKAKERVKIYNCGIGEKEETAVSQVIDKFNIGGTHLELSCNGDIDIRSLDSFDLQNVVFLKIDVEGMELSVLRGGVALIDRWHPVIMVESFDNKIDEVRKLLSQKGYVMNNISTNDYICEYVEK